MGMIACAGTGRRDAAGAQHGAAKDHQVLHAF